MREIVFDAEADELLDKATTVHCVVAILLGRDRTFRFYDGQISNPRADDYPLSRLVEFFGHADRVIGHNIINYDLPLLAKFFGLEQTFEIVDTYIWSKTLWPDRPMPKNCPMTKFNPLSNKHEKIGPHSLDSWGFRVGSNKIHHFDFSTFTEDMLLYNEQDTIVNKLVYQHLLKEAGFAEEEDTGT